MSDTLSWPPKDPQEVLDYQIDWSGRIPADDAIVTSSWVLTPATGITITNSGFTSKTTTVWFSGGTLYTMYAVTNRIVTSQGRTLDQTVYLDIQSK